MSHEPHALAITGNDADGWKATVTNLAGDVVHGSVEAATEDELHAKALELVPAAAPPQRPRSKPKRSRRKKA